MPVIHVYWRIALAAFNVAGQRLRVVSGDYEARLTDYQFPRKMRQSQHWRFSGLKTEPATPCS